VRQLASGEGVAGDGQHRRAGVTSNGVESATSEIGGYVSESAPHVDNDTFAVDSFDEGSVGVLFDGYLVGTGNIAA
jgi:hypothetical protein